MIEYIDEQEIKNKRVLLRVDYDVPLHADLSIADDLRITQSLPTLQYLLDRGNKLIIVSHLGNPKGHDEALSLKPVVAQLQTYFPKNKITLIDNFLHTEIQQEEGEIIILENIRFFSEEKNNNQEFAQKLSSLADVYVNDAFAVCHRNHASVISVPPYLPSYGGLLLKKEVAALTQIVSNPHKPFIAVLGGAKVSTKIKFLEKLLTMVDSLLIGGEIANTFLKAKDTEINSSLYDPAAVVQAKQLLEIFSEKIVLPCDMVEEDQKILDIGPKTILKFTEIIAKAKTIMWNGPLGYVEKEKFKNGTRSIFKAITQNSNAVSLIGGGDTIATIKNLPDREKISHISTGGGAMLEFIEKGTLPGIQALEKSILTL